MLSITRTLEELYFLLLNFADLILLKSVLAGPAPSDSSYLPMASAHHVPLDFNRVRIHAHQEVHLIPSESLIERTFTRCCTKELSHPTGTKTK